VGHRYAPMAPEARLTRPANPRSDSAASAFPVRSQLPFELSLPSLVNATPLVEADGQKKWETFYGEEALTWQKRFLDHFLRVIDNGLDHLPRVRLEVRKAYYAQDVRSEEAWPPASIQPTALYLCGNTGSLLRGPAASEANVRYRSRTRKRRAVFSVRFERAVELIGGMSLKVWVSTSEGDDLDLFVVLRKLDSTGREVFFSGFNGYQHDAVAKGWLRVSHRELDVFRSTPLRPWHSHTRREKLRPDEIVSVEIEIWPSATLFEAGTTLQLSIRGCDAAKYPGFRHTKLVNRGWHTIFTGGRYDSHLMVPLRNRGDE